MAALSSPRLYYTVHRPTSPQAPSPSTTIILIHGGALSSSMYRAVTPLLTERGYTVITPDLPGHGQSIDSGFPDFSFAQCRAALGQLLENLPGHLDTTNEVGRVILVGISLGGQVVLDFLAHLHVNQSTPSNPPTTPVSAALVSGVPLHPPTPSAPWEVPRLPLDDQSWMATIMADVTKMGMEKAERVKEASLGWTLREDLTSATETSTVNADARQKWPPTQVLIGEHDVAMAKRDYPELVRVVEGLNGRSKGMVLEGAWHNHSIDVPERFAEVLGEWVEESSRF